MVADPPAVEPKVNILPKVLVSHVNPPVPVYVNPVAVAIDNIVVFELCNTILPDPKLIERVLALLESNIPVVIVKLAKFNVPLVNVVVPVALNVSASPNVVVPE